MKGLEKMKFAFIIYRDMTLLDFAGAYDSITRLKTMGFMNDLEYDLCSLEDTVKSFEGAEIVPNKVNNDLSVYDFIFIPGGNGIIKLLSNNDFLAWIKNISESAIITAVCGGSLVLGAAGFLKGKKATTHPTLMQFLNKYTENVSNSRIVEDGNIITARGVTSSIDLGLYLCEKIAGPEIREKIQKQMDYMAYTCE
jgi:transcriptional regulator GlxA family with amidase domain